MKYLKLIKRIQSNPANMDTKGAIESVRTNGVSVLSGCLLPAGLDCIPFSVQSCLRQRLLTIIWAKQSVHSLGKW